MLRRVNLVMLLGLAIGVVFSFGISASAQPLEGSENALPEDDTVGEAGSGGLNQLEELQRQAEAADGAYRNALHEENRLNDDIVETRKDLTETQERLTQTESDMRGRAKEIYKHGNLGMLDALLQADNFREFVQLSGVILQQLGRDQAEVQKLRQEKSTLEQTQKTLENQVQEREGILEEETNKRGETQQALTEAQEVFSALEPEEREDLGQERAERAQEAIDRIFEAVPAQDEATTIEEEPIQEPRDEAITGDEQVRLIPNVIPVQQESKAEEEPKAKEEPMTEEEPMAEGVIAPGTGGERGSSEEFTAKEEQDRQAKVSQALAETIREFAAQGGAPNTEPSDEAAKNQEPPPLQNPVAEKAADAAQKQEEAKRQAKETAEQVALEREAEKKVAEEAEAAKTAKLAAEQAHAKERDEAQVAAEEAQRRADLAADEAAAKKAAAEEAAKGAVAQKQDADEAAMQLAAKREAAQPAAVDLPPAPNNGIAGALPGTPGAKPGTSGAKPGLPGAQPGITGAKPTAPGSGGGVVGEAMGWLDVPYDYSHMAGMTRAGVDCSAFTAAVFAKFGVVLPDSPVGQWGMGVPVSGRAKAGDLVFWSEDGSGIPTHVGIADGNGNAVHSSIVAGEVTVTPIDVIPGYLGAKRVI